MRLADLDPDDRTYVEQLADDDLRATAHASLLRYRGPERLRDGDPVPDVELFDLEGRPVALRSLLADRPALLVFGSYT